MAATYVTEAQLRTALGIGTLYDDATVESVCQAAEDLISKMLGRVGLFWQILFKDTIE